VRVAALVERPDHVCCRYRIATFRCFFEEAGHSLQIRPWPRNWWSWLRLGRALRDTDVVILQRRLLQGWQRFLLRRAVRWLVFDFDDAIFLRDSYAPKGLFSARRLRRFIGLVRAVDAVAAGNVFLQAQACRWTEPAQVHWLPTCVDPERYPLTRHLRAGAGVKLVWIGSASTLRGLEVSTPLLEEIGRRIPALSLKLICDRFLTLEHLPIEACPWTETSEASEIAAGDIGISFLPDDLWSEGKCGLKVLQYMAAGLPVVANPVGVQAELIRDGETGFLVENADEWVRAIARLSRDPELRRRMGWAGRRRVEEEYSVRSGAARWLAVLGRLTRGGRVERQRQVA
jgi:glycosyltransferase involved in cell wall biosynthesis